MTQDPARCEGEVDIAASLRTIDLQALHSAATITAECRTSTPRIAARSHEHGSTAQGDRMTRAGLGCKSKRVRMKIGNSRSLIVVLTKEELGKSAARTVTVAVDVVSRPAHDRHYLFALTA